ncbi:phospholipase D-like domain-containing protein [Flavobacterium sp.]|uniref:phospholipase D-like domain-containing protein n=1 Tax=Flavobacterium sp. TaxID=239 RepID=UPI002C3E45D2|nr:phospholipase D-like domain-containing protein [Flavobacterium sp.]HSD08871.1 phospholipase D-like domain-containing protein [Flavobacterium sp.]
MQTEAVFENIAERIQQEIAKAQKSIFIAVAWFTNRTLFNALVNKSKNGCSVSLIISNDSINLNSYIDFEQLNTENSRVYKIGNGDTELMHNKFCVIDDTTVITGSYNWSYKAENNFENVVITYGDLSLTKQFVKQFHQIKQLYYPKESLPKNNKRIPINQNHLPTKKEKPDYIILDPNDQRFKLLAQAEIISVSKNIKTLNNDKATGYRLANVKITMPNDGSVQKGKTMIYEKLMDLMEYEKGDELTLLIEIEGKYAGYSKAYLAKSANLDVSAFESYAGVNLWGNPATRVTR